jgi:hypothetical protein
VKLGWLVKGDPKTGRLVRGAPTKTGRLVKGCAKTQRCHGYSNQNWKTCEEVLELNWSDGLAVGPNSWGYSSWTDNNSCMSLLAAMQVVGSSGELDVRYKYIGLWVL